jgi:glucose dehydrogenase/cytochrome c553
VGVAFGLAVAAAACSSGGSSGGADGGASKGAAIYEQNCAACHGATGGGGQGPRLAGVAASKYSPSQMQRVVSGGRDAMPAFEGRLSKAQIAAVVDFARTDLGKKRGGPTTTAPRSSRRSGAMSGLPPEFHVVDADLDWPIANGDYESTRTAKNSRITAKTVSKLTEAWAYEMPGGGTFGNLTTTPLVSGDSVYVGALDTKVHAIDRKTGKQRWVAGKKTGIFGPTGVGIGYGQVYGTAQNAQGKGSVLVAYDAKTGKRVWATDLSENGGDIDMQPSAYDGLVFAATAGYGAGTNATIYAVDVETGKVVWDFPVIQDPKLWGHPDLNGGGGIWYPPAIDEQRRIVYFGTGNPYPFPGTDQYPNGSSRPGDNKWTDSMLALDIDTGKLVWGHQAIVHDLFDRDAMLAARVDVRIGGKVRSLAISTGKLGVVYGLDAATGKEMWKTKVGTHQNDDKTALDGPTLVYPGSLGGAQTPLAIADGTIYACVMNAPSQYAGPKETSVGFNVKLGTADSELVAIDAATGKVRWDVKLDGDALGAATVVNDLVFTSTFGGTLLAFDRTTGKQVWSWKAGGGINGWPAIAGDEIYVPVGIADPPRLVKLELPD